VIGMAEREGGYRNAGSTGRSGAAPGDTANEARGRVEEELDEARASVKHQFDEAKDTAREKGEELKHEAKQRAEALTSRAGDRITAVAHALRRAGGELRTEGEERLASYTADAASQVERFGSYLEDEDPKHMLRDIERIARKNPAIFIGSTLALGVLAGRFLRSNEPEQETVRGRMGGGNGGPTAGPRLHESGRPDLHRRPEEAVGRSAGTTPAPGMPIGGSGPGATKPGVTPSKAGSPGGPGRPIDGGGAAAAGGAKLGQGQRESLPSPPSRPQVGGPGGVRERRDDQGTEGSREGSSRADQERSRGSAPGGNKPGGGSMGGGVGGKRSENIPATPRRKDLDEEDER